MKKLLAVLVSCMAITCSFASCGSDSEGTETNNNSSSQQSTQATTEAQTEAETEAETEEDTTEAETEEDTDSDEEEGTQVETKPAYDGEVDESLFLGKWEADKLVDGEEELSDMSSIVGAEIPVAVVYQFEFKEDGTVGMADSFMSLASSMSGEEVDMPEYTWTITGEDEIQVYCEEENEVIFFTLKDDMLVSEDDDGMSIYLKKVDEFTEFDYDEFMNNMMAQDGETDEETTDSADVAEGEETSEETSEESTESADESADASADEATTSAE